MSLFSQNIYLSYPKYAWKIHFALVDFLLVLSFLINYVLNFISNTYVHSWSYWYVIQMKKHWPKLKWSYNAVHQFWKIVLPKTWGTEQEHTTMVLPFRIKLKKGCTKNPCVNLCNTEEVAKPGIKMTLWYWKITAT